MYMYMYVYYLLHATDKILAMLYMYVLPVTKDAAINLGWETQLKQSSHEQEED